MPRPRKISTPPEAAPVKRGRGRPRKDANAPKAVAKPTTGRRGRPKVVKTALPVTTTAVRTVFSPSQTAVIARLHTLISDTYTLMLATHHAHWNVEGPMFFSLHGLFEQQYNELFLAVDELAERVRALGAYVYGGGYADIVGGSTLRHYSANLSKQDSGEAAARHMIGWLANANLALAETAQALRITAENSGDFESADLANVRATAHQKAAWMLRSHLR